MAIFTVKPQNVQQVDDLGGNAFSIFTIQHTASAAGNDVAVELDPSVVAIKHIETVGQTVVTVTLDSAAAEFPTTGQRRGYTKTASIPSESASGTYTFCARHSGSAAGVSGTKLDY